MYFKPSVKKRKHNVVRWVGSVSGRFFFILLLFFLLDWTGYGNIKNRKKEGRKEGRKEVKEGRK